MKITVAVGSHAYAQLIQRLNIQSPDRDEIFETLNNVEPWYFKESKRLEAVYYLGCPTIGGQFVLGDFTFDGEYTGPADYFTRTFKMYPKIEGKPTKPKFVWYKEKIDTL